MKTLLSSTAMTLVLAASAIGPAAAQEEGLRRIIEQQQQQIEELRERFERTREADLADTVTRGDHPGSFKLPGTDTSVRIGGYEVISNSTGFRLRHAFGEIGPTLAGQTWTLFMPLTSCPETVDFFGPAGIPFIHQGQLRYTHRIDEAFSVAASAQNAELGARTIEDDKVGSDRGDRRFGVDTLLDFVSAVTDDQDGWHGRVAGVARLLDAEVATDTESLGTVPANLIWEPDPKLQFGVEYIVGRRTFDEGDLHNTAPRVQLAAQSLL